MKFQKTSNSAAQLDKETVQMQTRNFTYQVMDSEENSNKSTCNFWEYAPQNFRPYLVNRHVFAGVKFVEKPFNKDYSNKIYGGSKIFHGHCFFNKFNNKFEFYSGVFLGGYLLEMTELEAENLVLEVMSGNAGHSIPPTPDESEPPSPGKLNHLRRSKVSHPRI